MSRLLAVLLEIDTVTTVPDRLEEEVTVPKTKEAGFRIIGEIKIENVMTVADRVTLPATVVQEDIDFFIVFYVNCFMS